MPPSPSPDMRMLSVTPRGTRLWSIYRHRTSQVAWVDLVIVEGSSLRLLRLRKSENVYAWPEGKHGFFKVPLCYNPGATLVQSLGVHLFGDMEWFCHNVL